QLNEGKYLFNPTRIEWETWIISPDNQTEHRRGVDFIFSVAEMRKILANSGFELKIVFSIPGRKEFTLGDQRAYLVAKALSWTVVWAPRPVDHTLFSIVHFLVDHPINP